jgi:hypothetical protein
MSGGAWLCVGFIALIVILCVYHAAYDRGYAAGQYKERRAIARLLNYERQRGLQAEQDIDYLYQRGRWQIAHQSSAAVQSEE